MGGGLVVSSINNSHLVAASVGGGKVGCDWEVVGLKNWMERLFEAELVSHILCVTEYSRAIHHRSVSKQQF
ncbi:hypothetical protein L2E82_40555 [Cichorium intybus]|uniref:Uncharacterized protein n=1 Tax=Cichorium intybus TaxID=13427 RepID=A0ACB9AKS2_CICIN|nr:hypothetical protein L2E82_40555 [Cichorium intybus]